MSKLSQPDMDYSQLGHILQEIKTLVASLCKGSLLCVRRSGNLVTHSLAKFTNYISNIIIWIEDPPLALEALFFDVNTFSSMNESLFPKKKKKKFVIVVDI